MKPIDDYKQQIEAWKLDVAALREENAQLRDEVEHQRRLTISSTEAGARVIESLKAEVKRIQDELVGKKAVERSKMRRYALSLQANLACPCGSVLQVIQQLDAHLDHMCNDESWRDAALRGGGE